MRVLNFKSKKFPVGKKVIIVQEYNSGNIDLCIGDIGTITGETYHDIPDLNIFNVRVVDIDFGFCQLSMGESLVEMLMEQL